MELLGAIALAVFAVGAIIVVARMDAKHPEDDNLDRYYKELGHRGHAPERRETIRYRVPRGSMRIVDPPPAYGDHPPARAACNQPCGSQEQFRDCIANGCWRGRMQHPTNI